LVVLAQIMTVQQQATLLLQQVIPAVVLEVDPVVQQVQQVQQAALLMLQRMVWKQDQGVKVPVPVLLN
jgi:hypothetical protein